MDILKRMTAARSASVTCSASRHAAEVGERLVRYGSCQMMADDAGAHEAGESIAATVAALWEARAEIERVRETVRLAAHASCRVVAQEQERKMVTVTHETASA